jgi:hypothetical protein
MRLNDKVDTYNIVSSFSNDSKYDFHIYAKGYRMAAKSLYDKLVSQNEYGDYEGYPIVFLYRHAFELNLKNIIYWAVRLTKFKKSKQIDEKLYTHHLLKELSKTSGEILNVLFKDDLALKNVIKNIKEIANDFTNIDPNSFSYRYPIDIKGNYSTKKHQVLNLTSLTNAMEDLLNAIEAINFGLNVETDRAKQRIHEILSNFSDN